MSGNRVGPCTVADCLKVGPLYRGWCGMHYQRWRNSGDLNRGRRPPANGGVCSIPSCGRPHDARGWCERHVQRWRRNGHPTRPRRLSTQARFWLKVNQTEGCWLWTGTKLASGYGVIVVHKRRYLVHRVSYTWFVGPISSGLELDHLCRNPACVRPDHLEAVTHTENVRRGLRGRLITHCPHGHEYVPENTYRRPSGHRVCRTCWRRSGAQVPA